MKLRIKNGSMIEVEINSCFSFAMGEDLVETREKFLNCMGQQFDGAIYQALEKNDNRGFTHNYDIPNVIALQNQLSKPDAEAIRQRDAWLSEKTEVNMEDLNIAGSYDTLKEIADYVACSENRKKMEGVLQMHEASLEEKPGYSKLFK